MPISFKSIDWDKALCRLVEDKEKDQFHLDQHRGKGRAHAVKATERAREICKRPCPILEECLLYAYENKLEGVYGATTTNERRKMREEQRKREKAGMNKATPIPDSIHPIANGSMENATCLPCGAKITRSVYGHALPWWHAGTGRIDCAEEKKKKQ